MAITLGRDTVCPLLRSTDLDHVSYKRLGNELPLIDVVPLNRLTHTAVTYLRELGLAPLVNLVLRTAYACWFVGWAFLAAMLLHLLKLSTFDPLTFLFSVWRSLHH